MRRGIVLSCLGSGIKREGPVGLARQGSPTPDPIHPARARVIPSETLPWSCKKLCPMCTSAAGMLLGTRRALQLDKGLPDGRQGAPHVRRKV